MGMEKKTKYDNFDMTLEECKDVFDSIDGLVIVDQNKKVKYLAPDMVARILSISGNKLEGRLTGQSIEEIHPTSKIEMALQTGYKDDIYFYFTNGITNIAKIKPVFHSEKLVGAVDFDIFRNDFELKNFLDKIVELSEMGVLNLSEAIDTIMEGRKKSQSKYLVTDILGRSQAILNLKKQIIDMAESDSTVIIMGPTGSGKELVAHSIHNISRRKKQSMIEINCAAIPENLVESELFGYEEGTFTGAKKGGKIGKFEMADKGTLFLDEVDQLPYHVQPKLLRALQEREITRIGGSTVPVNIRVIAATNKNLKHLVKEGKFREDLYYRLNVVEIRVPPLAERREDIPMLAYKQVNYMNKYLGKHVSRISDDVMDLFLNYSWPGNVRELNNILERAMNICHGTSLETEDLKGFFTEVLMTPSAQDFKDYSSPLNEVRDRAEREAITKALEICGQNRVKAARLLKISRASLYNKIEKYKIGDFTEKEK